MNKQEIFNKVAKHLLTQNSKAMDGRGLACRYRGPEGKQCAIGCLIPDDLYDPNMESRDVSDLLRSFSRLKDFFEIEDAEDNDDIHFLNSLQEIHDTILIIGWRAHLKHLADSYGLDASVLNEV